MDALHLSVVQFFNCDIKIYIVLLISYSFDLLLLLYYCINCMLSAISLTPVNQRLRLIYILLLNLYIYITLFIFLYTLKNLRFYISYF